MPNKSKGRGRGVNMQYRGKAVHKGQNQTIRATLTYSQGLTGVAGNFYGSYSSTLVNSSTEWASFAARYEEFRVLSLKVHFIPLFQVNTATTQLGVGAIGSTRDVALTPTTVAQVAALADSQYTNLAKAWTKTVRASDIEELVYTPTNAPGGVAVTSVAVAFNNLLPVAAQMGLVTVEFLTEFKSKN